MLRRIQLVTVPSRAAAANAVVFFSTDSRISHPPRCAGSSAVLSPSTRPLWRTSTPSTAAAAVACTSPAGGAFATASRGFLGSVFGSRQPTVKVDNVTFDKEGTHYHGTVFGFPADDVIFYAKVIAGAITVLLVFYIFFKGYALLTRFSMQTVARLGFFGGFFSCMIIYTTAVQLTRRAGINANAVYNQSIALVMHNEKVQQFLGTHPRTGEFKTYSASGGFKLPLMRRIRSGTYELSDLLGLKPRRLQMLFVLQNPAANHEGVVACDVRRETTGFLSSTNVYRSLSITLNDKSNKKEPETIILIGKPEDVIYHTLLK